VANESAANIGSLLAPNLVAWGILAGLTAILAVNFSHLQYLLAMLVACASAALLYLVLQVLIARRRVLIQKEVDLFFGIAKLVCWDPTEGVLILKDKAVQFVDDNLFNGGGMRMLYPVMGEELVCRAPLEIQTLAFQDEHVLTQEYLPLCVHGTVKWQISDLHRFYLLVSQEIHKISQRAGRTQLPESPIFLPDRGISASRHYVRAMATANRKLAAAEHWLRYVAEEQTRAIVARVKTGLLVAERVLVDLPPEARKQLNDEQRDFVGREPSSSVQFRSATDGLAAAIYDSLQDKVKQFGIEVHEVSLQQVELPQAIHQAAVEACKSAYLPTIAQREAAARKTLLQAEADVIGAETVGAREVVGSAPAFALVDFLTRFLAQNAALRDASRRQRGSLPPPKPRLPDS